MAPLVALATGAAMYGYPMYASYKVLSARVQQQHPHAQNAQRQSPSIWRSMRGSSDMMTQAPPAALLPDTERWVMYWCIAAIITLAENWFGWAWRWVPMYDVVKLLLVLWLILPQTNGTVYVYAYYLAPFLAAHERDIDKAVSTANGWSLSLVSAVLQTIANTLRTQLAAFFGPALQAAPQPAQVHSMPVPPSQHNPAQGTMMQAGAALQAGAPVAMGIGAAVANWISSAAQQAHDAAQQPAAHAHTDAGDPGAPPPRYPGISSRHPSVSSSRHASVSSPRHPSTSSPRQPSSRQASVSSPPMSPLTGHTEVLRTRRVFSPNPFDEPGPGPGSGPGRL
ncbi:hypothetical protein MCUN1_003778 [Malassezia cuniculi]|uniref:Protein YOP1 n=1 Tax=Malassezia cuniculi TaxID=948313 RepID=A0AAF0EY56_9BASI|nr:hypothetical protein MCUN1_003778 [Malassezia cuniculi]